MRPIRRNFLACLALSALCALAVPSPALAQLSQKNAGIGRIDLVEGDARIIDRAQHVRSAKVGEALAEGDTLSTGKEGEIHLTLSDGSVYALRGQTQLTLITHKASGTPKDSSVVKLVQGALRAITGWLGRRTPNRSILLTPTATVGIRGTDHETVVVPPDAEGAGTYNKVNAGATVLKNRKGEVEITPGQAAFAPPKASPRLLPEVPPLFQPTRNEKRLEGLDAALARTAGQGGPGGGNRGSESARAGDGGTVRLKGNTQIDAQTRNTSATAVGQGNTAKNQAGVIGGQ